MESIQRMLTVNGAELTYVEQGEGNPVVLVHGSLGDYRSWGPQIEAFSQLYRVIAYSRRRHWPNAWPSYGTGCSVEEHASDLGAFLDALGLDRPHLIGSSYGALTALTLAARGTHAIRTLVLGEPPLFPWLATLPDGRELLENFMARAWHPAGKAFRNGDTEGALRAFIDGVTGEGVFDKLPDSARAAMTDNANVMGLEFNTPGDVFFPSLTREDVAGISIPTLLVTGQISPAIFHEVTDELASVLPGSQRVEIVNASHGMHLDNPVAYNEAVLTFLDRH